MNRELLLVYTPLLVVCNVYVNSWVSWTHTTPSSPGVWDVMSNEEVVDFVRKRIATSMSPTTVSLVHVYWLSRV